MLFLIGPTYFFANLQGGRRAFFFLSNGEDRRIALGNYGALELNTFKKLASLESPMRLIDAPRSALSYGPNIIVIGRRERKLWPICWFENAPRGDPCDTSRLALYLEEWFE